MVGSATVSKKVSLTINGSRFDIELEEDFAQYLTAQMKNDFNTEGNNDAKTLLYAYVRKNAELFKQEEQMNALLEKLGEK
jgi:hypothetical protein